MDFQLRAIFPLLSLMLISGSLARTCITTTKSQGNTLPRQLIMASCLSILFLLSGCATPTKMAFQDESAPLREDGPPILLMTATIRNTYKVSHQPKLMAVNVERAEVKGSQDRLNFTMDDKAKFETDTADNGYKYFLRMELENGRYVLRGLTCMSSSFPFTGFFFAPLHEDFEASGSGVFYLGHVSATVRERNENEFKAGPSIPLIDQAVVGASGGTFDIEITDQWEKDQHMFVSRFPVLARVDVKKAILPEFDRGKAQQWWEEN